MGGEGRAAHTHNTGLTDDIDQLLGGQGIHFFTGSGLDGLVQGVQVVIFNDNTHHGGAAGMGLGLHGLDLAGDGCMNRHAKALVVTDLLALFDQIVLLHQGLTGGADMLGHGNNQDIGGREFLDSHVTCVMLIISGMHTAEKRKRHISSPLSKFADSIRIIHNIITHENDFVHTLLTFCTNFT